MIHLLINRFTMATQQLQSQHDIKDAGPPYDIDHDEKIPADNGASPVLKSKFAHLSKLETLKTFKRLYATGLGVSLGGMYAGYCLSVAGNIIANPGKSTRLAHGSIGR